MTEERQVIGYTLEPIYETARGAIATHAFVLCSSCGSAISGSGGPWVSFTPPQTKALKFFANRLHEIWG